MDFEYHALTKAFYECIDDTMKMITLPTALVADSPLSYIVANYIQARDGVAIGNAVAKHIGEEKAKMFPELLKVFLSSLTQAELSAYNICSEVSAAPGPNAEPAGGAATEQECTSERGASNGNSSRASSLSKDEFANVNFNEERPTSTTSTSNTACFIGVSTSEAISKYAELGEPPATPMLDFYRGISTKPYPGEGPVHVGEWYVNLPVADVDDLILSNKLVSILFPHVETADEGAEYNHGTVKAAEMWWIAKDRVAKDNISDLTTAYLGALDIKVEWSADKLTAVLITTSTSERIQEAMYTTTAANVFLQMADFLEYAGLTPLSKATRELLEGCIG